MAAIPEARKGPKIGLLNRSGKCLLPESRRTKYVHMRPIVRHHVTPKPCKGKKIMPTYTSASLLPWYPVKGQSRMKAKPGPGQGWKGFMASIEIDAYPFRYIVMSHDFAKIPALWLMIMFAIDMFHQIRKFARTTQVANRVTILKRTTAPYRQEQKT